MAAPAPAPVPAPAPSPTPSQPPPGWQSSEAWLTLLVMILGALPSTGLLVGAPPAALQIVGLISSVLAALGYTTNRTSLKKAHLALSSAPANDNAAAAPARLEQAGFVRARVMLVLAAISIVFLTMCTAGQKWTNSFVGCEKADFGKMIGSGAGSQDVLRAVEDLILKNPADLEAELAGLVVQSTLITVNCAITATEELLASQVGSGAGSAAGSGSGVPTLASNARLRARVIDAYPGLGRALAWAAAHPAK